MDESCVDEILVFLAFVALAGLGAVCSRSKVLRIVGVVLLVLVFLASSLWIKILTIDSGN